MLLGHLGHRGVGRRDADLADLAAEVHLLLHDVVAVHGVLLRAVAGDVARLAAAVARLAGRVEGSAARSRAVARDVAELAASVALHGLSLAVASKVVGASALVARRRALADRVAAAAEARDEPTTGNRRGTPNRTRVERGRAGTLVHVRTWADIKSGGAGNVQCSGQTAGSCGNGPSHRHR